MKRLGRRPEAVAKRAASVLDGQALDDAEQANREGSESGGRFDSNAGSYGAESTQDQADDRGQ